MKNIVITGSTRGLGFSMAHEFLKSDCNVTISGRNEASFSKAKKELSDFSENILYVICDVSIRKEIDNLWELSIKKWGKIDIWINNAGQNSPNEYIYNIEQKYIDQLIATNISGVIHGSSIAAKQMIDQGFGQIWNMEGLGSNNMIIPKTILYGTSKHALTYFSKGLAKEIKKTSIKVGRLSPGMVLTDFITKSADGGISESISDENFIKIFNILADKPETVAKFFIPKILKNKKNNRHIVWLTNFKTILRFMTSLFKKRKLI